MATIERDLRSAELRRLQEDLSRILTPALLRYLLSDLTVTVDRAHTDCRHITFTVSLVPGLLAAYKPEVKYSVEVLVTDANLNFHTAVVILASRGGSATLRVEFPLPAGVTPGSWARRWIVVVDPYRKFAERNDGSNGAIVEGY